MSFKNKIKNVLMRGAGGRRGGLCILPEALIPHTFTPYSHISLTLPSPPLRQAPAYNRTPAALLALDDQQGQGGGSGADGDAGVYRLAQVRSGSNIK